MYAYAMQTKGRRCGGSGELYELRAILRAMTGAPGGGERGRHHAHGPGPRGGSSGFGFGGFSPGGGHWRGRKARRGDIRTAALLLLAEEPRNGYQIMQEVQERSGGVWSPSPGSVYPALSQLEDEGLIRVEEVDGRRLFALTDAGRELLEQRDSARPAPWEEMGESAGGQPQELMKALRAAAVAAAQVARTGNETQIATAQKLLAATRRDLYRLLAEDDQDLPGGTGEE